MIVRGVTPGRAIPSPAYLDASLLVSYFVQRSNTPSAIQAIAELLAQEVHVILSPITIAEFWWGVFDALYNRERATRGESPQRLTQGEYRRHHRALSDSYGAEIGLIRQQLRNWPNARGIAFRAAGFRQWLASFDREIEQTTLTPSDAVHLSLARRYARSLVTADRDFAAVPARRGAFEIIVV